MSELSDFKRIVYEPERRALTDRIRELQVERDLLASKLDVAENALKEIAGRCHNRLQAIADIADPRPGAANH